MKGRKNRDKISSGLKDYWKSIPERKRIKLISHLHSDESVEKRVRVLRKKYEFGKLKAWNDELHKRLNTGRTHIKRGQHLSPDTEFKEGKENRH